MVIHWSMTISSPRFGIWFFLSRLAWDPLVLPLPKGNFSKARFLGRFLWGNLCAPIFGLANEHLVRLAIFLGGNPKLKKIELHHFFIVLKCFMKKANALAKSKVAPVGFCFVWNLRVCPQKLFYHRVEMEVCQIIFYLFSLGKDFQVAGVRFFGNKMVRWISLVNFARSYGVCIAQKPEGCGWSPKNLPRADSKKPNPPTLWKGLHSFPRSLLERLLKFVHWMYKKEPVVSKETQTFARRYTAFFCRNSEFLRRHAAGPRWLRYSFSILPRILMKGIITWHEGSLPPILAQSTTVYISQFIFIIYDLTQHVPTCTLEKQEACHFFGSIIHHLQPIEVPCLWQQWPLALGRTAHWLTLWPRKLWPQTVTFSHVFTRTPQKPVKIRLGGYVSPLK